MANIDDLRIDTPPQKPRRSWTFYMMLALINVGVIAALIAHWSKPGALNPAINETIARPPTASVPNQPSHGGLTAGGYLEVIPPGPVLVAARVAGLVKSVEVVEGDVVKAGQVLIRLDDTIHRQHLAEAEAALNLAEAQLKRLQAGFREEEIAEAEARMRKAEVRHQQAGQDLKRLEQLAEIGATPARILIEARSNLAASEAEIEVIRARRDLLRAGTRPEDVAVAQAELAMAQAALERARWAVDACEIKAPVDGVVLEQVVRLGGQVSPGVHSESHGTLLTLFDPTRVQGWVEVNQRDANRVFIGQAAILTADSLRGRPIEGRVARVLPKASLQRNTIHVKIEIPDPPEGLRPEMGVQVTFQPAAKDTVTSEK